MKSNTEQGSIPKVKAPIDEHLAEQIWEALAQKNYHPEALCGQLNKAQGYQLQLDFLQRRLGAGEVQAGWKVGLTAPAIQNQVGWHEPVFGYLLEESKYESGAHVDWESFHLPAFETELCLYLGQDLAGAIDISEAREAIVAVCPAFELVEKRGDFTKDIPFSLADNVEQKGYVLGKEVEVNAQQLKTLPSASVKLKINEVLMEEASATQVMGDPAASVVWLAHNLAPYRVGLKAGMWIMSGSLTRQYRLKKGDKVQAEFNPFGEVEVYF